MMGFFTTALCVLVLATGSIVLHVNACSQYPCWNGGTCLGTTSSYSCVCPTGYIVPRCASCRPVDLVFVVDVSGSMDSNNRFETLVRPLILQVVQQIPVDEGRARIGSVLYSTSAQVFFNLAQYSTRAGISTKWNSAISIGGWTNTDTGINTGCNLFSTPPNTATNVMVVITDGASSRNPIPSANNCRATKGALIIVVAVGPNYNLPQIRGVANTHAIPDYYVIRNINTAQELTSKIPQILNRICSGSFSVNCYGDIMKLNPTGASVATAVHGGLRHIRGVPASNTLIDMDVQALNLIRQCFVDIGRRFCIHPALIAAIASRESRVGKLLDGNGFGNQRKDYGIMQCDIRRSGLNCMQFHYGSCEHISMMVESALLVFIRRMQIQFPGWTPEQQLQAGVAGYNHNVPPSSTWRNLDRNSMGHDYSNDVIARAQRLVNYHGWIF